jgi:hypothetical protein
MNIQNLRAAVAAIHKTAGEAASRRRALTVYRRALKPGIFAANFAVGDYFLVAKREFQAGEKLFLRWRGPRVSSTLSLIMYSKLETCTPVSSHPNMPPAYDYTPTWPLMSMPNYSPTSPTTIWATMCVPSVDCD